MTDKIAEMQAQTEHRIASLLVCLLSLFVHHYNAREFKFNDSFGSSQVFYISFFLLNSRSDFGVMEIFAQLFLYFGLHLQHDNMSSLTTHCEEQIRRLNEAVKQNYEMRYQFMTSMRESICA